MRFNVPFQIESEPVRLTINGKSASSYEYNFAMALDKVGLPYIFQVSYLGGRRFIGGIVLDFLVLTEPLSTPVWINGEFYHQGRRAALDYYQRIAVSLSAPGTLRPALVYWGKDVGTPEDALRVVRRDLA